MGRPRIRTAEESKAINRAASLRWKRENRERFLAGAKKRRDNNPDQYRGYLLKKKYNISLETYRVMNASQKELCAICRRPETAIYPSGALRGLSVDHDHQTGAVRDLLCGSCNTGLGSFKDAQELLLAAAGYLARHQVQSG